MSGFPIFGRTIYFGAVKFIVGKRLHKSFRVTSVAVGITASGVSAGESEFPDLGREIDVSPEASIGVGICTYTTYDTVGFPAGNCDDVDDTAYTFGLVFGRGIRDNFDIFNRIGRHTFENFFDIVSRHYCRTFPIDQYFIVALSVQPYIFFGIDCNHGNLPQHIQCIIAGGVWIGFHIVSDFIDVAFY